MLLLLCCYHVAATLTVALFFFFITPCFASFFSVQPVACLRFLGVWCRLLSFGAVTVLLAFCYVQAWFMLGQSHAENDQDRLAISCLERAVEIDPYSLDALLVRVPSLYRTGLPVTLRMRFVLALLFIIPGFLVILGHTVDTVDTVVRAHPNMHCARVWCLLLCIFLSPFSYHPSAYCCAQTPLQYDQLLLFFAHS